MKLLLMLSISMTLCHFVLSANAKNHAKPQGNTNSKSGTKEIDVEYQEYLKTYNKKYASKSDEDDHKKVYMASKKMIEEHNKRYENKHETYKMCLNEFADKLPDEFHCHQQPIAKTENRRQKRQVGFSQTYEKTNVNVPASIDWRKKGAVTDVKHQGNCESCWAFATTGAIEGQLFLQTDQLVSLSEQSLVDCSTSNSGCNRGLPSRAYTDINQTIRGLVPTKDYPYEGKLGECRYKAAQSVVKVVGYRNIKYRDEEELKEAVATVGPIAIGIHACIDTDSFSKYCGGIFDTAKCCPDSNRLTHAMLLVGYDSENGIDYWIIKNSHGKNWGENGFMRLKRGDNTCGIGQYADYPIIVPTGPLSGPNGQTNLQSGTNSIKAASAASESLRNSKFILALVVVVLFNLAL